MIRSEMMGTLIELTNDDLVEILETSTKDADLDDFEVTDSIFLQQIFFKISAFGRRIIYV